MIITFMKTLLVSFYHITGNISISSVSSLKNKGMVLFKICCVCIRDFLSRGKNPVAANK